MNLQSYVGGASASHAGVPPLMSVSEMQDLGSLLSRESGVDVLEIALHFSVSKKKYI